MKKQLLILFFSFLLTTISFGQTRTISGTAGWRMISIPIANASASDISDDTAIQGVTGGANSGNAANIYYNPSSNGTGGWTVPTNMSTAWGDGLGVIVYFYNNTTGGSSELPIDLDASGSEPGSNVEVALDDKYTLIGNPFQSNINLDDISGNGLGIGLLKGGLKSPIKIWDNSIGTYQSVNFGEGIILAAWQGFFLERDETLPTTLASALTIPTSAKTGTAADAEIFSKTKSTDWRRINLNMKVDDKQDNSNILYFKVGSHEGQDSYDGSKLSSLSGSPTLAFLQDFGDGDVLLSQDARAFDLETKQSYDLVINDAGVSGEYTISWETMKNIPSDWEITFIDREGDVFVDMQSITSYTFDLEAKQKRPALTSLGIPSMKAKAQMDEVSSSRFAITVTPSRTVENEEEVAQVKSFKLEQNYPNPFNPSTTIKYAVGTSGPVSITIYNITGQKVAELLNTTKNAGTYQITWNAAAQASGIYYYRLTAPGQVLTRQMTLIK